MTDPAVELRRIAMAMRESRVLFVAAELRLADHLADGEADCGALADRTGTDPAALLRLLRALVALGIFTEPEPNRFGLTAMGERLRSDHPRSFRAAALFLAGDLRWQLWADLAASLRTGAPAAERALGQSIFEHYASHPEEGRIARQAMSALSGLLAEAVLAAYDFSRFRVLMDVGGGNGAMINAILDRHPALQGVLFDQPHVIAATPATPRCRLEQGNFFDGLPQDADAHLLKQVVHDWDDTRAIRLLTRCRQSLAPGGTLLIVERVLPDRAIGGQATDAYLLDLEMLVGSGGRERTESEYRALLSAARFRLTRILATRTPVSVIEAEPV